MAGDRIAHYLLSPDGSGLVYTAPRRFERPGSQQILNDFVFVDLSSDARRTIASNVRMDYTADSLSWSPDSRHIAFRTGGKEERGNDCYVFDLEDGRTRKISGFVPSIAESSHRTLQPLWNATGTAVYLLRDGRLWEGDVSEGQAKLVGGIAQGAITQLILRCRTTCCGRVAEGSSAIVLAHDPAGSEDSFYRINLVDGHAAQLRSAGECYTCTPQNTYVAVSDDESHAASTRKRPACDCMRLTDANFQTPRSNDFA